MTATSFLTHVNVVDHDLNTRALQLTHDPHTAQDLKQDTLLRAFRYREKFAVGTNFRAWIFTIMRNLYLSSERVRKNRQLATPPRTSQDWLPSHHEPEYAEALTHVAVIERIGTLYSVPFLMFYRGYTYDEIAGYLHLPVGTVKSRIFMARQKLKQQLTDNI